MTTASDLVVLIPGFLGYDRFGDFAYFKETVGDALRAGFDDHGVARGTAVTAVTTDPAGSLASRQASLVPQLHELLRRRPGARLHLVGHSTGGLDAELLLRTPLLDAGIQDQAKRVRPAVHSVVTIAAPLAGTTVSDAPIAKLFALQTPGDFLEALRSKLLFQAPSLLLELAVDVAGLLQNDKAVAPLLYGVLHGQGSPSTFLLDLILRRALATDLSPARVRSVLAEAEEDPVYAHVHRARFVTVARSVPRDTAASRLFTHFYDSVRKAARPDPAIRDTGSELVRRASSGQIAVIGKRPLPTPIDEGASDGIVNSARQIFALPPNPGSGAEAPRALSQRQRELSRVVALVIADHLDVVGYFEGKSGAANGFLSSGSSFSDEDLAALYRAVAGEIRKAMPSLRGTSAEQSR